jgi:hypothetical protein
MKRRSFFGLALLPLLGLGKAVAKETKPAVIETQLKGPYQKNEVRTSISCRECIHWGDDGFSDRFPSIVNLLSSHAWSSGRESIKSAFTDNLGRPIGHGYCPILDRPTFSDQVCLEATYPTGVQPYKGIDPWG